MHSKTLNILKVLLWAQGSLLLSFRLNEGTCLLKQNYNFSTHGLK